MSSIVLLKDHEGTKKGTTISVPFHKGLNLISQGIGEYLDKSSQVKAEPSESELLRKQNDNLRKQLEDTQLQLAELLTAPPAPPAPPAPTKPSDAKDKK